MRHSLLLLLTLTLSSASAAASTLGSLEGNVTLTAGQHYQQTGSDLIALKGDIAVVAEDIAIREARETNRTAFTQKTKQSGLTISISNPVISAVQTIAEMHKAAADTSDPRMQALAAGSAALAGKTGMDALVAGHACYTNPNSAQCSLKYAQMRVALDSYKGKTDTQYSQDLNAGLEKYTASAEKESFKTVINVPHYDAQAIANATKALTVIGDLALDMTPIIGDAKAFAEAQTKFDYALALVGTLGPAGDGVKALIKEAKVLMEAGDVAKAAEKLGEAERGIGGVNGGVTSEGAANVATVQGLKDQLASENLANIAAQDSRLAAAVNGSGRSNPNFSIGTGTATEANQLGQTWVGDGARLVSNQNACPGCLISADGTRIYRPPSFKPNTPSEFNPTGVQANFVQQTPSGQIISNGHLVVKP